VQLQLFVFELLQLQHVELLQHQHQHLKLRLIWAGQPAVR
jgi:hypothetical protein